MDSDILKNVDIYIRDLLASEDVVLKGVIDSLIDNNYPQHSITATQGKFLQVLTKLCKAKKILELGTLGGYSTIWFARALDHDGKVITIESNPSHAKLALQNIKAANLTDKIELKVGNALEILPQLVQENNRPFDLIFIDADKSPYIQYFEYALKLAKSGSVIIADNVIREGKILDKNNSNEHVVAARKFNKMLSENDNVFSTIIQTVGIKEHDGMAISVVK